MFRLLNGCFAPFYVKNCLFAPMQFTSNTDGMISLERLSKDAIPSVLEVNCIGVNKQFFHIKWYELTIQKSQHRDTASFEGLEYIYVLGFF